MSQSTNSIDFQEINMKRRCTKRRLKITVSKFVSATEYIPDTPEAIIFESMLEGFEQNGHNRLKKLNSKFKVAISM